MLVYLFVLLLIIIFRNRLGTNPSLYAKNENKYVIITCAIFILLAALRWIIPGTDIEGYVGDYRRMQTYSYSEIWENWQGNYVVYYFLCKVFGTTSLSYHFLFGLVQFVTVSGFVRIINRFSIDRLFCLFLYFTIGLFSFSITGLKQAFAMGLVWHAFAFMFDKKYLWSIAFALLAFYSHKTSAIFMLSFALLFMQNVRHLYNMIVTAAIVVLIIAPTRVLSILSNSLGDEHYLLNMGDSSYAYTALLFYLLLFIIAYSSKSEIKQHSSLVVSMSVIFLTVNLFAQVTADAFRLALYYMPFLIIFVSNKVRDRNMALTVIVLSSIYLLYTSRDFLYKFFWQ